MLLGLDRRRAAPRPCRRRRASAEGPTSRIAAPPVATRGRHHSTATGGGASAFATATPNCSIGCSSARPQTTRAFGNSAETDSRKSHFRRVASSRTTSRSGSAAAIGTPGRAAAGADVHHRDPRSAGRTGRQRRLRRGGPSEPRPDRGSQSGRASRADALSQRSIRASGRLSLHQSASTTTNR